MPSRKVLTFKWAIEVQTGYTLAHQQNLQQNIDNCLIYRLLLELRLAIMQNLETVDIEG